MGRGNVDYLRACGCLFSGSGPTRGSGTLMNPHRREHDPLDCAIRNAEAQANLQLACLISAAVLVAVLFILVL